MLLQRKKTKMCQKGEKCPTCLGWEKVQEALDTKLRSSKIRVNKEVLKKAFKELLDETTKPITPS